MRWIKLWTLDDALSHLCREIKFSFFPTRHYIVFWDHLHFLRSGYLLYPMMCFQAQRRMIIPWKYTNDISDPKQS